MSEPMIGERAFSRARRLLSWTILLLAGVSVALLAGLAASGMIAGTAPDETWAVRANVGETFGVLNAIFSGLALAAVVVTFWMQFTELRSQRAELALQRDSLIQTKAELHRSAEADLRHLHFDLVQLSIADPELAQVWPQVVGSPARHRQYQYANLIIQHSWLQLKISDYTEAELQSMLRYLFSSPIIREYWTTTKEFRQRILVTDSFEHRMTAVADEVCSEYEHLLRTHRPDPATPAWNGTAEVAEAA
ncbi:hypothetical protein DFJ67_1124 [Asanoa ferruginea]|uniref:Phage abortive infection protein n=1 Tax=Asanoa ferruginea TaxID=53367 RepID=A0A3D9ZFD7_9ACTN|nr:DUF6082 family protein [Asanoa ferruginea]REF95172.1 hypothetical protein DFJ67_1124 [Asanoa ferruginea]GIF53412.1 hypothetical protein Afe04nite_79510 [Asanoa ferruginea]